MKIGISKELGKTTTGRLNNGVAQVPPARGPSELRAFAQTLPVSQMSDTIIKAIGDNRVIMVAGETGSGKTTQVIHFCLMIMYSDYILTILCIFGSMKTAMWYIAKIKPS